MQFLNYNFILQGKNIIHVWKKKVRQVEEDTEEALRLQRGSWADWLWGSSHPTH